MDEEGWRYKMGEYMRTCVRYEMKEIPSNSFMKKPYFKREDIQYYLLFNKNELDKKIHEMMINQKRRCSEECKIFFWLYPTLKSKKKEILEKCGQMENQILLNILFENGMKWMIHYFQFYMIVTEFLYDHESKLQKDLETIYDSNKITSYLKDKMKDSNQLFSFVYLYNELKDLREEYHALFQLFLKIFSFEEENIIFSKWIYHNIDLKENEIAQIQFIKTPKKKKWISAFLCMSNSSE